MKYYTFYRENNKFDDIIDDITLSKLIKTKIKWYQYLALGLAGKDEQTIHSYITLKYGDEIRTSLTENYAPVPFVDYIPTKKKF